MTFYLCIDGGGTKTSAVLAYVRDGALSNDAVIARSEAGPSNLTFGLELCLSATQQAFGSAQRALEALEPAAKLSDTSTLNVWAGYAGCSRPPDHALLFAPLCSLFPPGTPVRLTGDAELLTAPLYDPVHAAVRECVTLICGTGSNGLLWRRSGGPEPSLTQAARSGGWGPLLGDEGSGWAMGKAAITSLLTCAANGVPLVKWQEDVLAHFGITTPGELIAASSKLDSTTYPSATLADSERKKRIAACTPIVVGAAAAGDAEACRVVRKVARQVVDTLEPLVEKMEGPQLPGVLVVAGGLGQVDTLWGEVGTIMQDKGWKWAEVVKMPDPGMSGLKALMAGL